ncbi:MAG: TonB-dependent receptor [Melioribacteraceae bacterium]|nr:TonB-dependent receptor [Melioribacteraceae bacterium]
MKSFLSITFIVLLFTLNIHSQDQRGNRGAGAGTRSGGKISGIVIDASSKSPIEYSNIILYSTLDSTFYSGTVTNNTGEFILESVKPGNYYIELRFMGYESERIDNLEIGRANRILDLGTIELKLNSINLEDVEVVAERSGLEYKIDKKVVNVDKYYTAASGNAVDVLENVPSVDVDVEGNVSLRGSGNFTLLIDNRPTVLDANDALQQIPASTIQDIEIITNPSAKFDPDGPTGIINLVMKKQGFSGSSGTVNLNTGLYDNYGGDFLLNYKTGIITTYFGADYNKRYMPGTSNSENITSYDDRTSYIYADGSNNRGRTFYGIRGGVDFNFSEADALGLSFRYGNMDMKSSNSLDYLSYNSLSPLRNSSQNKSIGIRGGDFLALSADYRHVFGPNGHELSTKFHFHQRDMDETSTNELLNDLGFITNGKKINEDGPSDSYRLNIDYQLPFSETNKFEIGYQNRLGNSTDYTSNLDYDLNTNKYVLDDRFTRNIDYQRYIHSIYSLYSGEVGKLGYQGGIRAEYTDRKIELVNTNEKFIIDRWDYFPTLHFSYKLNDANQFILSYTKRIERPRGWNLEPFITWSDAYNVRRGNPALKPEDIDSYEAGYQRYFGKNLFSLEAYYRVTNDKIEDIRSVYEDSEYDNVILRTIENVGKDYSFGTELMLDFNIADWWKVNLMGNVFDYRVEGFYNDRDFSRSSTNWKTRLNSSFNISKTTKIQFNNSYNSKTVSSQGTTAGFFTSSLAVRQEILENLTATLQIRDIFSSADREFTSEGLNFYNYNFSERKSPMVMLNLNFNINNYKQKKESGDMNGAGGEEEDF